MSVAAPGFASNSQEFFIWLGDFYTAAPPLPPWPPWPPWFPLDYSVIASVAATFEIALSGGHMDQWTDDDAPDDRGFLWFGDRDYHSRWVATPSTLVTVTAICAGITLTASGGFGTGPLPGGETDLGFLNCGLSLVCNCFYSAATVYARISGLEYNGSAVSLQYLDMYNPGDTDPDTIPDPIYNGSWSRSPAPGYAGVDAARVSDVGGMAMWWEGAGSASGASYGPVVSPRWTIHMKAATGKFGTDVSYD